MHPIPKDRLSPLTLAEMMRSFGMEWKRVQCRYPFLMRMCKGDPMKPEFPHHTTLMRRGALLRLQGAPGLRIVSVRGTLWITQQDDTRDWVLAAGESLALERLGTVLINAIRDDAALSYERGIRAEFRRGTSPSPGRTKQPLASTIACIRPRYDVTTLAGRAIATRRHLVEAEARWMRAEVMALLLSRAADALRAVFSHLVARPVAAITDAFVRQADKRRGTEVR
jgi:hypothetical protein